jgi:hypothetical protein
LRPAEVLEFVAGVIVTQHSGDGKANQYYLRGFNLDHGTDFATYVDGMPVNMPTHAHGQGYSDLNWLIPELVDRIAYGKGPYYADEGDFASAGAAHIRLFDALPRGTASVTLGEHAYGRALLLDSVAAGPGTLFYALEAAHNDGPWEHPEKFHRANGVLRYVVGNDDVRSTLTAMAYAAGWNATDQVPQRAVDDGPHRPLRRRRSHRPRHHVALQPLVFAAAAATTTAPSTSTPTPSSRAWTCYSNFTYFLDDPVDGDQFEQAERRCVFGLAASRSWTTTLAGPREHDHGGPRAGGTTGWTRWACTAPSAAGAWA